MMVEIPLLDAPVAAPGAGIRDVSDEAARLLKLLADPTRRRIFLALMQGETCNCEMVGMLGLPQNLISHHLRRLRQVGLIRARRDERDRRWIYYTVDRAALGRVYRELGVLLDPARIQEREPQCGPATSGC
jgi:ArsR family transcriptional regulator, arsenate/arsenite/antimonite-responsive transcriptional repressor